MPDELSAPEEKQRRGPRSNQKLLYTHGMGTWKSKNRHKYLLQYHIIFSANIERNYWFRDGYQMI